MRLENISAGNHALSQFLTDSMVTDWYLEKLRQNVAREFSKSQNYILLRRYMPPSVGFYSLAELANLMKAPVPFVVKFDAKTTLGIQTVVVNSSADFKQVYQSFQTLNCNTGIVQQFVQGHEYTVTVLVGKQNWATVGTACDYKKQFDNDLGLNTFGLGSISPAPELHPETQSMIAGVVDTLRSEFDYQGLLSCQFLVDTDNKLWLLEYNGRICDPEFQSMAELVDPTESLIQCQRGEWIDQPMIQNKQAVTIGLVHQSWPAPQPETADIELANPEFRIWRNHGEWSKNLYWGSVTASGSGSYSAVADSIYQWLSTQQVAPYRYRTDIGKWGN